jgi:3-oxoacyl-(acyl-carrier-protein) synthase
VYATEAARPFDRARSGFVLGEGAYVMLLEPPAAAAARDVRPYAMLLGVGESSDIVPINAWPVVDDAALPADAVDVVYASANGAPGLDETEALALARLFGSRPLVTSVKGAIGESAAVSAAACVAACLCGRAGKVPPIVGLDIPDVHASSLTLVRETSPVSGDVVLINAFASGGALVSLVMRVLP